jgi:exopolyphosphatase/pppGpp-phosphohydrolase
MSLSRVLYRIRQFYLALRATADPRDLEQARSVLTPAQAALFTRMQSSEQAHAVSVYRQLVAQGESSYDLLAAALLHDVGKSLSPLRLWERVLIVLARAFFPAQSRRWGSLPAERLRGWRRAFIVAEQHPAWGAALAAEAGASPRLVTLIRLHQEVPPNEADPETRRLLSKLQAVDDNH